MLGLIADYAALGLEGNWQALLSALLLTWVLGYYLVTAWRLWAIDVREHRLPDRIVLPLYAGLGIPLFALAFLGQNTYADARNIAYCGVIMMGFYWVMRLASRRALGLGDVKLAGALGMLLGFFSPNNLLWGNLLIFLLGGLWALALVITRRAHAKTHIAFGPFMLLGTTIAVLLPAY